MAYFILLCVKHILNIDLDVPLTLHRCLCSESSCRTRKTCVPRTEGFV